MPIFDADVRIQILTYKDGLLSRVAHDLRLDVTGLTVEAEGEQVVATIDAHSLRVDTAMKRGQPQPRGLSSSDKAKIEATIRDDVLRSAQYPTIVFRSEFLRKASVAGALSICGREQPVRLQFRDLGEQRVAEVPLDQRAFGIKPYRALGGTLKLKPEITVVVTTDWGGRTDHDVRLPVS